MASSNEEVVTALDGLATDPTRALSGRPSLSVAERARAFYELAKPNLSGLVVISGILGFYLGARGLPAIDWWCFLNLVVGMALTASGACALNMYIERDIDRLMRRTRVRPIPSGRVSAREALAFSLGTFTVGAIQLALFCGPIPPILALATLVIYAFVYTPMKQRGPISIWIGAVPGAIPPVMGYAAVRGEIGVPGLVLFAILFLWQFPHFLALAWMYEEDYARAGFHFLPEPPGQQAGLRTAQAIVVGCVALMIASVLPSVLGMASWVYAVGAVLAGIFFLRPCVRATIDRTSARARGAFLASVTYLPILLALLVLDRLVG